LPPKFRLIGGSILETTPHLDVSERTAPLAYFRDAGKSGGQKALIGQRFESGEWLTRPGGHGAQAHRRQHAVGQGLLNNIKHAIFYEQMIKMYFFSTLLGTNKLILSDGQASLIAAPHGTVN
jgi:hypothetical protein